MSKKTCKPVEEGGYASELGEFMPLSLPGETQLVEVIEVLHRFTEEFVLLCLQVHLIEGIIDVLIVDVLH